tara:strand:- start:55 stop:1266 length:1212 start_codon:yes stop_codon:yes gene_type:complete
MAEADRIAAALQYIDEQKPADPFASLKSDPIGALRSAWERKVDPIINNAKRTFATGGVLGDILRAYGEAGAPANRAVLKGMGMPYKDPAVVNTPPTLAPDNSYGNMGDATAQTFGTIIGDPLNFVQPGAARIANALKFAKPDALKMLNEMSQGARSPMDVWHGSPHRFPPTAKNPLGEFDPMKIGTGQGAQTYGHGLYVAENPKVAGGTEYRDPQGMFNRLAGGMNNREEFAHDMISQGRKPAEVFQIMKQKYGQFFNDRMLWADLDKVSSARGNLYKVDLADEQIPKMLDWDKPFNKQHPEVQQALVNIANSEDEGSKMLKLMQNGNPSGKDIFRSLLTEPQLIDSPSGWIGVDNKKEISKLLQSEGIPGIRYLDQGSRAGGAGTSNFVVFDPKHMNIIGRE